MTTTNAPTIAVNAASAGAAAGSMSSSTLTSVVVVAVLMPVLALAIYYFCLSGRAKAAREAKEKARAAKEFMLRTIAEEEALERGKGGSGSGGGAVGGGGMGVEEMRISLHEFYSSKGNSAARIAAAARKNDRRNSALPSSSSSSASASASAGVELTRAADYVQRMDAFTPAPAPSGGRRESTKGGGLSPASASASAPASEGGRRYKFEPGAAAPVPPTPPSAPKRPFPKPLLTQTHSRASALLDAEHKWEY